MKKRFALILAAILCLLIPLVAQAKSVTSKPSTWLGPNVKIVDAKAGPYKTITKALAAITDSSATKPYTIMVMPGRYNEQILAKAYVTIRGVGRDDVVIWYGLDTSPGAQRHDEFVVRLVANSHIENLTLESHHRYYSEASTEDEFCNAAVVSTIYGAAATTAAVDNASVRNCRIWNYYSAMQFGIALNYPSSGAHDDVVIEGNTIEAGEAMLGYCVRRLRFVNNVLAGTCGVPGDLGLIDIKGEASTSNMSYECLIANNVGTIEGTSTGTSAYYFVTMCGYGHQIVGNKITLWGTVGGSYSFQGVSLKGIGVTATAYKETIVEGNEIGFVYRHRSAAGTYVAALDVTTGAQTGKNCWVRATNNLWTLTQMLNRYGGTALGTAIDPAYIYSVKGQADTSYGQVCMIGPDGLAGTETWVKSPGNMAVFPTGYEVQLYSGTPSVILAGADTWAALAAPISCDIPAGYRTLRGFRITNAAPGGTASGTKSIKYSIGTTADADADLHSPTTDDNYAGSSKFFTALGTHGSLYGRLFANTGETLYLNFAGKSSTGSAAQTVNSAIVVYAVFDPTP